jgi:hypothetical protein
MNSTSTPVKKACDNVFDLTNLSLQVRKGELTEAAMLYSSTKGSFVKWIWSGSSVERETLRPLKKNIGKGFLW